MKYRKRPLVIDAVLWNGRDTFEIVTFVGKSNKIFTNPHNQELLYVMFKGNELHLNPGDWLIRGVKGELYPCTNEVFEATYDEVVEEVKVKKEKSEGSGTTMLSMIGGL